MYHLSSLDVINTRSIMIKRDEKYDGELRGSTERPLVQTGITAVGEKEANEAEEELDGGPLEVEIEEFYKSEEELESTVSEDNFTKIMRDKYGRCRSVPKATPPRLNRMSTDKYEANWGQVTVEILPSIRTHADRMLPGMVDIIDEQ